jgi:hypothetical protein
MSQREVATIVQPCILCEGSMEVWHVYLDEEYDVESIIVEELEHECLGMRRLLRERIRNSRRR